MTSLRQISDKLERVEISSHKFKTKSQKRSKLEKKKINQNQNAGRINCNNLNSCHRRG